MWLSNHLITVHTCMTSKSGKSSPKSAYSIHMRTTCPKRVRAGHSENEFSAVLKQKNVLVIFLIKKNMEILQDCSWVWKYNRMVLHKYSRYDHINFFDVRSICPDHSKKFCEKNSHHKSLLGLMCKTKQSKICRIYVISNIFE